MARTRTERLVVRRLIGGTTTRVPDDVIVEEPMEIRLDEITVTTTMRTPGHDFELATGFCFTEGLLGAARPNAIRYCATGSALDTEFNVVTVDTGGTAPPATPRLGTTTSSCGLCGTASLDQIRRRLSPLDPALAALFSLTTAVGIPSRVAANQSLFNTTGGVHAAAAFAPDGAIAMVREDVGRHNAVDKVVGRLLLDDQLPASNLGLYVSGRASFEIVQKAWAAGFPILVAVSAPTQLAVATARAAGMTLVGFVRDDAATGAMRANVYSPE